MEQAGLTYVHRNTIYKTLKEKGLIRHRCKKRPKLNAGHAALRLRFAREYRNFNWRRHTVKFSNECLVKRGCGKDTEWCFCFLDKKWNKEMFQEKDKPKGLTQMVWACFWVTPNSRVSRSPLIIMERDPNAKRNGYTSSLYTETLERGLLSHYRPRQIFQQDNVLIHNANYIKEWLEKHGV